MPTLPNGSIQVEHVWKKFRADRTAPLFYDQILRAASVARARAAKGYRWVLKDVSVTVEPGGTLGLIGINGSGKTTLLKIISGTTYQSAGECQAEGRLGALLSVTSGIHPDLTGRENVFLYGAVLGMRRKLSHERFDQIVEFAGLEDAIDRQVKFFSLGMQMRLGFSIAAFLEPDILLVDEVLSVGDANFQQKCLRRIEEIVRLGTTLVYVSHDLTSVEATCTQSLWLADAVVQAAGPTREVAALYRKSVEQDASVATSNDGVVRMLKSSITGPDGGQVVSLEDAEIQPDPQLARVGGGRLLRRRLVGHGLSHVHHQAPRPLSVRRLRGQVPTAQHPAAQGPLLRLDGDDELRQVGRHAPAPVEARGGLRCVRPGHPRTAGRGHGGDPAVRRHDLGRRMRLHALRVADRRVRRSGMASRERTPGGAAEPASRPERMAKRPHPLTATGPLDEPGKSDRQPDPCLCRSPEVAPHAPAR